MEQLPCLQHGARILPFDLQRQADPVADADNRAGGVIGAQPRNAGAKPSDEPTEGQTSRPRREGPGGSGVEVGVNTGQGLVLAFFNSGQLASAVLMVSVGLASKVFLAFSSKKR